MGQPYQYIINNNEKVYYFILMRGTEATASETNTSTYSNTLSAPCRQLLKCFKVCKIQVFLGGGGGFDKRRSYK